MLRVDALKAYLVSFGGVVFPVSTNPPQPTPTAQMRRLLAPETVLPTTPPLPTPAPILAPLPDGTMPLTPPPMPTPILPNANTLLEQFNLPSPAQLPELLKRMGETTDLKDSEKLAMQQKIVMADFEKSLAALIAKQRNPNVPNMTLSDAVQIALKQNPDILNAIQHVRLTQGQLVTVAAQAMPQLQISSVYNQ
jgi:hypothetical protein